VDGVVDDLAVALDEAAAELVATGRLVGCGVTSTESHGSLRSPLPTATPTASAATSIRAATKRRPG
jgi:hypothetical protein